VLLAAEAFFWTAGWVALNAISNLLVGVPIRLPPALCEAVKHLTIQKVPGPDEGILNAALDVSHRFG
jgi:hypothetical protein